MKKIINKPENVVTEMLDGLAYVHSDLVHRVEGFDIIRKAASPNPYATRKHQWSA